MEAQSYTATERRAANQVWAAAGEYGFEPLFLARCTDGTVDFYMNCIVGLVHKYYGDDRVRALFQTWDGDIRQPLLDDLTWLYLECAAYRLELPCRPVLAELRRAHADYFFAIQYKLSRQEWMAKNQLPTRWPQRPRPNPTNSKRLCWPFTPNLHCLTARFGRKRACTCTWRACWPALPPAPCPPR